MASKKRGKRRAPAKVSYYLSGWTEDPDRSAQHLAQVLVDALCALKRLQLQGALDAYPQWKGEGSATVQLGIPEGDDARYLEAHPSVPERTPLMVVTGSKELASSMVGFSRGVSKRWRKRIVSGKARGPAKKLPPVMLVEGAEVVVADGSVFAEHRHDFEQAGWKVRTLGRR